MRKFVFTMMLSLRSAVEEVLFLEYCFALAQCFLQGGNEAGIPEASMAVPRVSPAVTCDLCCDWEMGWYGRVSMQLSGSNLMGYFNHGSCPLFPCPRAALKRHIPSDI